MGVDWYSCNYCGETFPDCGDFVSCECGNHWCCEECAEEEGYKREHCKLGYDIDDSECDKPCWKCEEYIERSCNYCREEDFEDSELLDFAIGMLGYSREELIDRYKKAKGEPNVP